MHGKRSARTRKKENGELQKEKRKTLKENTRKGKYRVQKVQYEKKREGEEMQGGEGEIMKGRKDKR